MNLIKEEVKKILIEEIDKLFRVQINDLNENILSPRLGIPEVDFIYLFENLEKTYNINLYTIFSHCDCNDFSINGLTEKIMEQCDE